MGKEEIIVIASNDKKYHVVFKEEIGNVIKVEFNFENEFWFGIVQTISSNGSMTVKVKGICGKDSETDLI